METKGLQYVFHGRVRFVEFVVLFFSVSFKYSREMKKKSKPSLYLPFLIWEKYLATL